MCGFVRVYVCVCHCACVCVVTDDCMHAVVGYNFIMVVLLYECVRMAARVCG